MNTLSNYEIIEIIKNYNIPFNGIFSKDKLPTIIVNGYYIINLQDADDGDGSHWTSLYKINDGFAIYYDSFGFVPPLDVEEKLYKYDYNDKQIQDITSSSCGYYCIAFIKFMHNKNNPVKAFDTFINLFKTNTLDNENMLNQILYL